MEISQAFRDFGFAGDTANTRSKGDTSRNGNLCTLTKVFDRWGFHALASNTPKWGLHRHFGIAPEPLADNFSPPCHEETRTQQLLRRYRGSRRI